MSKELLLMNENAIAALVFLRETENPYDVFCRYIVYCLKQNDVVSFEKLTESVKRECGLHLPFQLYKKCFNILEKDNTIEISRKKNTVVGYKLLKTNFNKELFKEQFDSAKQKEKEFLIDMVSFLKDKYNREWTISDARQNLIKYLNYSNTVVTSIFLNDDIFEIQDSSIENSNDSLGLIQKYLNHINNKGNGTKQCFMNIIYGFMILNGAAYSELGDKEKEHLKGVKFYFDTKLILRYLGFTTDAYKDSVHELVDLITGVYGGKVCIFQKTLSEVANVIRNTRKAIKYGNIRDLEMELYYNEHKGDTDRLFDVDRIFENCSDEELLRKALTENGCFEVENNIEWKDKKNWKYNIDGDELKKVISDENPNWNEDTISVDVDVFIQLNMLRRGDYTRCYGGYKKLPVFVTTNIELIRCIKKYIKQLSKTDIGFKNYWEAKNLPYITDNTLMCELWLPNFTSREQTTQIVQALVTQAMSPLDYQVYNELKEKIKHIKEIKNVNITCDVNKERERQLTEYLLKNGKQAFDELENADFVLSASQGISIDLVFENQQLRQNLERKEKQDIKKTKAIEQLTTQREEQEERMSEVVKDLIVSVAEPQVKRLGVARLFIIIRDYWWLLSAIVIGIAVFIIDIIFESMKESMGKGWIFICLIPVVLKIFSEVLDTLISQKFLEDKIENYCNKKVMGLYEKKIRKNIPNNAKKYEIDIVKYCFDNCKALNRKR